MASHDYHEALDGYHPAQILHDGCGECEERGADPVLALNHLDAERFRRAWLRAADWNASIPPSGHEAEHICAAEAPLLRLLWAMQLHFENVWPLGYLPEGTR